MIKLYTCPSKPQNRRRPVDCFILTGLILFAGVSHGFSADVLGQENDKKPDQKTPASEKVQFVSTNWE